MHFSTKRFTLFVTLIIFTATIFSGFTGVYANSIQDSQNKLNSVQSNIADKKKQLQDVQKQKLDAQNQLVKIQQDLIDNEQQLNENQKKLQKLESDIAVKNKQIQVAQKNLDQENDIFKKRVIAMYINGPLGYLSVLVDSKDFADFLSRYDIVKKLIQYDKDLIGQMNKQKEDIVKKKNELMARRSEVVRIKNVIEARRRDINIQLASRSGLFRRLSAQEQQYKSQIDDLSAESQQLGAIIKKLQEEEARKRRAAELAAKQKKDSTGNSSLDQIPSQPVEYSGGKLGWPVPGVYTITSPFGWREHPIYGVEKMHTGIDIAALFGSTVVAAGSGTVIWAGWYGGYGNAVVIDHGNGISTLYGHNSSLLVHEGQTINKGQAIAISGSTGNSTGPHVHFEVRENGVPVNPLNYVR